MQYISIVLENEDEERKCEGKLAMNINKVSHASGETCETFIRGRGSIAIYWNQDKNSSMISCSASEIRTSPSKSHTS